MRRSLSACVIVAATLGLGAVAVRADVKTRETTSVKLGGVMGGIVNKLSGQSGKDGLTSTVALKGSRLARINDVTGQIIDLSEEKIYDLDMKKKEYKVTTFEEMRQRIKQAQADAAKQAKNDPASAGEAQPSGKEYEFDVDVKDTGQTKTVAGYNAREVIVTVTEHEKGKKVEESGGFILTTDEWLAPKVAALDEIRDFDAKYAKAIYGDLAANLDMQQLATMNALYPAFQQMSVQTAGKAASLDGTPVAGTMTFESVKSADAMKQAQQANTSSSAGGGLGGMLARRIAPKPNTDQKTTALTSTHEYLSIELAASADDVAIPMGFKEKK